jgi:hypothetical protein
MATNRRGLFRGLLGLATVAALAPFKAIAPVFKPKKWFTKRRPVKLMVTCIGGGGGGGSNSVNAPAHGSDGLADKNIVFVDTEFSDGTTKREVHQPDVWQIEVGEQGNTYKLRKEREKPV